MREHIRKLDRFLTAFFVFHAVFPAIYFMTHRWSPSMGFDEWPAFNTWILPLTCIITSLLCLYSLKRVLAETDSELCEKSLAQEEEDAGFRGDLAFLLTSGKFWAKIVSFGLLSFLLPTKWFFSAYTAAFFNGDNSFLSKLKLFAILLPAFAVIEFLAHLTAIKEWVRKDLDRETSDPKTSQKKLDTLLTQIVLIYTMGCVTLLIFIIPTVVMFFPVAKEIFTLKTVLFLVGIFFAFHLIRYLRAFHKRAKLIKGIKAICRKCGYSVSEMTRPYLSIFAMPEGENFHIQVDDKVYSCKLICGLKITIPIILYENGYISFVHKIRIAKVHLFTHYKTEKFGYPSEQEQILILNPTPKQVVRAKGNLTVEMDNGQKVGNYQIYTATAFLNALERECLGVSN